MTLMQQLTKQLTRHIHPSRALPFPKAMELTPVQRWPTLLPEATVRTALARPIPHFRIPRQVGQRQERASIIVVTFNNLVYNRLCLESVLANTRYPNYEIVVVDNGSTDGTVEYLAALARRYGHIRVLCNQANRGFAPANNQGLDVATGDVLVLLNNDTLVPTGWLSGLVRHLQDAEVGMVGPVSNRVGNEAEIETHYTSYGGFLEAAQRQAVAHANQRRDLPTLVMFCAAMRRESYDTVGRLDERFSVGMFEDDDFSRRMRQAGYRTICAEDVLVHHFGQASIGKLAETGEYGKLFHANRHRFEEKWGVQWRPHRHRVRPHYQQLPERICDVLNATVPLDATVLVVSKGDDHLLALDGRQAWHFPQSDDGNYAGYHPQDSSDAIAHLEAGRRKGAEYLLIPSTTSWWLDYYTGLEQYLEKRYRKVTAAKDICVVYELHEV